MKGTLMALHRAEEEERYKLWPDVHGFDTQVGKETPLPFGMMPIVTQKMVETLTVAMKYIQAVGCIWLWNLGCLQCPQ